MAVLTFLQDTWDVDWLFPDELGLVCPARSGLTVPSDLDIAQAAKMKPITEIAEAIGLRRDELELYGDYKAKVKLEALDRSINH